MGCSASLPMRIGGEAEVKAIQPQLSSNRRRSLIAEQKLTRLQQEADEVLGALVPSLDSLSRFDAGELRQASSRPLIILSIHLISEAANRLPGDRRIDLTFLLSSCVGYATGCGLRGRTTLASSS